MDVQSLTHFFMWCTVINAGVLVMWAGVFLLMSDFVYRMHSRWFTMSREVFDVAMYGFLGFFKLMFIIFNLVPYIALLIVG